VTSPEVTVACRVVVLLREPVTVSVPERVYVPLKRSPVRVALAPVVSVAVADVGTPWLITEDRILDVVVTVCVRLYVPTPAVAVSVFEFVCVAVVVSVNVTP
jgi:hypothetical protein